METAAFLCKARRMSCEQAESHAVEARKLCEIEDNAGEATLGVIQCSVEGLFIVAVNDAACALDDVDTSDVAGGERERHTASRGVRTFRSSVHLLAEGSRFRSIARLESGSCEIQLR